MIEVVGIKYDENGRIIYVKPNNRTFEEGDLVVVLTAKGRKLARVKIANILMNEEKLPNEMDVLEGFASDSDIQTFYDNLELAESYYEPVLNLIRKHQLDMKVVDIVFPLNRQHVLISFVAAQRVDFRQLLKDLAHLFRVRIELRQINSREESKIFGGLGPCGRPLCCSTFLGEFPPVSIKMAKDQNLSLSSGKTNGLCGRLMCCLSYEEEFYRESRKKFPDFGTSVTTKDGEGIIAGIDVISDTVKVRFADKHVQLVYALEEVTIHG